MSQSLVALLIEQEGFRDKPYLDCCGKYWRECVCAVKGILTIGVGRNLDELGLSADEANWLLQRDVVRINEEADSELAWFSKLDSVRQDAILSMLFNLGLTRFRGFKRMIAALEIGDYAAAAKEMLDSKWSKQVPERAKALSQMMLTGVRK